MSSLSIGRRNLQCRPTRWGHRSAHQSCGPCSREPHSHPQSAWFNAAGHTHTLTLPLLNRTHSCLMALCNHRRIKVDIVITSPVATDFSQEPWPEKRGRVHLKPVLKQVLDQDELNTWKTSSTAACFFGTTRSKIKYVLYEGWDVGFLLRASDFDIH